MELRQLEDAGYRNSTALEIYPELVEALKAKYIPNLISRNNVIVQDLKFFIKETNDKFDIIMHSFPDLVAKVDSSGWPIENATYSVNILSQIVQRLNPEGILLVKTYASKDNPWAMDCYEAVLAAAKAAKIDGYNSSQVLQFKNIHPLNVSNRVDIFIAIKNGKWTAADFARVQSIEPTVTVFNDNLLGQSFEKIKSHVSTITPDDVTSYTSLYQKIHLKKEIILSLLMILFIILLALPFIHVEWSVASICFFSGLLYAVIEILSIKKLSFHFPNPFMAINWVFGIFAFTFWFSNWYLSKKLKLRTSLVIVSPIIVSMLLVYLLDQEVGLQLQWLIVVLVAFISAYNFSAIINSDKGSFASLLTYNTLGFVAGSGIVFLLISQSAMEDSFYILIISAFYWLFCIRRLSTKTAV